MMSVEEDGAAMVAKNLARLEGRLLKNLVVVTGLVIDG